MPLNKLVTVHILVQLSITKEVLRFQGNDRGVSEIGGDLLRSIEDSLDNRGSFALDLGCEVVHDNKLIYRNYITGQINNRHYPTLLSYQILLLRPMIRKIIKLVLQSISPFKSSLHHRIVIHRYTSIRRGARGRQSTTHCQPQKNQIQYVLQSIVIGSHLELQHRFLIGRYRESARLLDQKAHSRSLVQRPQFALVTLGPDIAQHPMSLNKDLPDIRHQSSSIPQRIHHLLIILILRDRPQIPRTEHLTLLLYHQMLVRNNPLLLNERQFLHLINMSVINQSGRPWPIDDDNCVHLIRKFTPNQSALVRPPNGVYAAD